MKLCVKENQILLFPCDNFATAHHTNIRQYCNLVSSGTGTYMSLGTSKLNSCAWRKALLHERSPQNEFLTLNQQIINALGNWVEDCEIFHMLSNRGFDGRTCAGTELAKRVFETQVEFLLQHGCSLLKCVDLGLERGDCVLQFLCIDFKGEKNDEGRTAAPFSTSYTGQDERSLFQPPTPQKKKDWKFTFSVLN